MNENDLSFWLFLAVFWFLIHQHLFFLGVKKKPHQLSESSFMLKSESWWGHLMKVTQVGGVHQMNGFSLN